MVSFQEAVPVAVHGAERVSEYHAAETAAAAENQNFSVGSHRAVANAGHLTNISAAFHTAAEDNAGWKGAWAARRTAAAAAAVCGENIPCNI